MLHIRPDDTQYAELRQLAGQAVGRVSERAHFVQLPGQGYSPREIGGLMGYDPATVRYWLKAYRDHGVAELNDAPRSGRPPCEKHLTAIVQAQASQPPPNYGYLPACWTVALLIGHLRRRFRIHVSAATLRQVLRRAGFRWTRPKLVLPRKRDALADEKRAQLAQALADPQATVLAADECDMHLLAVLQAMWQRIGKQVRILTPGKNHKRGVEFIGFLASLLSAYPAGLIYVIVDNASIHTILIPRWDLHGFPSKT